MGVVKKLFGKTDKGEDISVYTIDNGTIRAEILDFGAVLKSLYVPDRNGQPADIVLGFDSCERYLENKDFFGATIGPSANRTGKAQVEIDGQLYHLPVNENANNLHTDFEQGFHKKMWKSEMGDNKVTFSLSLSDGEYGLPGCREAYVTYSLNDKNGIVIDYRMTSDRKTLMNPTNHSYFNLAGHFGGSILAHEVKLNCSAYTEVDSESIPTGVVAKTEGTPFDFSSFKAIGKEIDADFEQLRFTSGYDHNFIVDGYDGKTPVETALVREPSSGRTMTVYTTLPGVQFYAGNYIDDKDGKDGIDYGRRSAFCLETQYWPDSMNHESFSSPVFGGDTEYRSETEYRFSIS